MSASESLLARLRTQLRDDAADVASNPGREAVETAILGLCGLGWLCRSVIHWTVWLELWAGEDPHPLAVDYGVAATPVVDATARQRWLLGLLCCAVGVGAALYARTMVGPLWDAGAVVGLLTLTNWGVLVLDPLLVQVLPDPEA